MREDEWKGFEDATGWLLDPRPDSVEVKAEYYSPPDGLPGCQPCAEGVFSSRSQLDVQCPRCNYNIGWADGASK